MVQEIITEFSKSKQISQDSLIRKVAIIHDSDCLSKGAQQALRRTMEKFSSNVIILFVASSVSKLIPAIRSRCIHLRIPLLEDASIKAYLEKRHIVPSVEMLEYCNGSLKLAATIHEKHPMEYAFFLNIGMLMEFIRTARLSVIWS